MGLPRTGRARYRYRYRQTLSWSLLIFMTQSYLFTNFVRNRIECSRYFVLIKDRSGLTLLLNDIFLVRKPLGVECLLCTVYYVLCYNSPQLRPPNHKQVAGWLAGGKKAEWLSECWLEQLTNSPRLKKSRVQLAGPDLLNTESRLGLGLSLLIIMFLHYETSNVL